MVTPPQWQGLACIILFCGLLLATFLVSPTFAQDMATSEKLKSADDLALVAVKSAAEAKETCDCQLLKQALGSTNKAAALLSGAAAEAENTGNLALAQKVYDMAANIVAQAIVLITEVCTHCSKESEDVETLRCFAESRVEAGKTDRLNDETIGAALDAGAIPARRRSEVAKNLRVASAVTAPVTASAMP
jgi:hypothetical protein